MKTIITLSLITLTLINFGSLTAFAQVTSIQDHSNGASSVNIAGTTIVKVSDGSDAITKMHVLVGQVNKYKIRRVLISGPNPSGWTDEVCWGPIPDPNFEGLCIQTGSSLNFTTAESINLTTQNFGELKVTVRPNGYTGSNHIRYYVLDSTATTKLDSVDVRVENLLSVKEVKQTTLSVYPNPATDYLIVDPSSSAEVTVVINDGLGREIFKDEIIGNRKVDLANFKNGVYLVTLISNREVIATKRIVIRK